MTFDEILTQVLDLLQRDRRVSYRALKRRFGLDDDYLADLKDEIIEAKQVARDERGTVLVWTGEPVALAREPTYTPDALAAEPRVALSPTAQPTWMDVPPRQAEPLPIGHEEPDAERRQLTVLFCDLVDSTGARPPARPGRAARGGAGLSRHLRQGDRPL